MPGVERSIGPAPWCDRVRPLNRIEVPLVDLANNRIGVLNEQFSGLRGSPWWHQSVLGPSPRIFRLWVLRLSAPIRESRRADSNPFPALATSDQLPVAEACTRLQIPHIQAASAAPGCSLLHRIALPVVSGKSVGCAAHVPLQRPRPDSRSSHDAPLLAVKYQAAQLQNNNLPLFSSANRPFKAPRTGADDGATPA
jgi:hypothetical protein